MRKNSAVMAWLSETAGSADPVRSAERLPIELRE
jgi:hypothetical protein